MKKNYQAQQQSDRALEQEQAAAATREIAQLEAVRTGDFDTITRGSDSGSENAQRVRTAENLDSFFKN